MPKLLDYLGYEFASFDEKPLNPVDSAALTQAAMLEGGGLVPAAPDADQSFWSRFTSRLRHPRKPARFSDLIRAERFDSMFTGLVPEDIKQCLFALAASPRFRDMELRDYRSVLDPGTNTQFAAIAFTWHDRISYIAFRGTDTSFTGWRENFDMAYLPIVPAQELALRYVEEVVPTLPGELHIGGHSKGGNLALFAALCCSDGVCERIARVWVHDAPGFRRGRFGPERYERLGGRLHRTLPQDSIVGMLMECPCAFHVVSAEATGIDQHNVFTWKVEGDDFVYRDRLNDSSWLLHDVIRDWLGAMDDDRAHRVVDALFAAIAASGAGDAGAILLGGPNRWGQLVEAAKRLDPESRDVLTGALGELAGVAVRRVGHDVLSSLPWNS